MEHVRHSRNNVLLTQMLKQIKFNFKCQFSKCTFKRDYVTGTNFPPDVYIITSSPWVQWMFTSQSLSELTKLLFIIIFVIWYTNIYNSVAYNVLFRCNLFPNNTTLLMLFQLFGSPKIKNYEIMKQRLINNNTSPPHKEAVTSTTHSTYIKLTIYHIFK